MVGNLLKEVSIIALLVPEISTDLASGAGYHRDW